MTEATGETELNLIPLNLINMIMINIIIMILTLPYHYGYRL